MFQVQSNLVITHHVTVPHTLLPRNTVHMHTHYLVVGNRISAHSKGGHAMVAINIPRTPRLTLLPRIWLIAALSFSVHSATTFALISFMYNMKAFRGFLM